MYFVPREVMLDDEGNATETAPRMIEDVHEEVTDLLFREAKVSEVKAKVVTRSYPFGDCRAPYEPTQCLKVSAHKLHKDRTSSQQKDRKSVV